MFRRFLYFVQYHNFFTLGMMALFMGVSVTFAASPDLRDSVVSQNTVYRSVDNRFIVGVDLSTYNMALKVTAVTEDTDFYYVDFSYNTIEVADYAWKTLPKTGTMKVAKKEILGKDLGLYVADQLGQIMDQQLAFLKDVQKKEQQKGLTQKVISTEYSGLIGQFLNKDEKEFLGYTPIIAPVEDTYDPNAPATGSADSGQLAGVAASAVVTQDQVRALVQEAVRNLLSQGQNPTDTSDQTTSADNSASTTASTGGSTDTTTTSVSSDTSSTPDTSTTTDSAPTPDTSTGPTTSETSTTTSDTGSSTTDDTSVTPPVETAPVDTTPPADTAPPVETVSAPAETTPPVTPPAETAPPAETTPAPATN